MYTYEDIKLQNQQDAFSAMYLCIARSVTDLCGRRVGERILREACRRAGRASGLQQRERLRQAGVKTNLHTLYHCGRDFVEDPRVRGQEIFDEEDRQIWEIYTCPLDAAFVEKNFPLPLDGADPAWNGCEDEARDLMRRLVLEPIAAELA